jgi:hypothetical protein
VHHSPNLKRPWNKSPEPEMNPSCIQLIDPTCLADLTQSELHLTDATHQSISPMELSNVPPVSMAGVPYVACALEDMLNTSVMMSSICIESVMNLNHPGNTLDLLDGSSCAEPCGTADITQELEYEDEDDFLAENEFQFEKTGVFHPPPSIAEAEVGHEAIKAILKPLQKNGLGYEHHGLDDLTHSHLKAMRQFLWKYING